MVKSTGGVDGCSRLMSIGCDILELEIRTSLVSQLVLHFNVMSVRDSGGSDCETKTPTDIVNCRFRHFSIDLLMVPIRLFIWQWRWNQSILKLSMHAKAIGDSKYFSHKNELSK